MPYLETFTQSKLIEGNYQIFMTLPAIILGPKLVPTYNFGSIYRDTSLFNLNKNNLSSYLVGLIESDGSIIVPKEHIKSYKPNFKLVFHIKDLFLAEIIQSLIGGNIYLSENYCRLIIKKKIWSFKNNLFNK